MWEIKAQPLVKSEFPELRFTREMTFPDDVVTHLRRRAQRNLKNNETASEQTNVISTAFSQVSASASVVYTGTVPRYVYTHG